MSAVLRARFALGLLAALLAAGCGLQDRDVDARRPRKVPQFQSSNPSGAGAGGSVAEGGAAGGSAGTTPITTGGGGPGGGGGATPASGTGSTGGGNGGTGPAPPSFDAGVDPDRNAVQAGELCDRFATIQCAGEAACCTNPGRDFNACKSALMAGCSSDLLFDQISLQPAAGFDPTRARTVLDEFERLASNCDPGIVEFGESQDGLRSMFAGTVAPGQSCRPSNILSKAQAGAALAACTMSATSACLPSATTWTCVPRADAGGACFTDINCVPGLFCDNPNLDLSGSNCMQRKPIGSPCKNGNECLTLFCAGGSCVAADAQVAYCPE